MIKFTPFKFQQVIPAGIKRGSNVKKLLAQADFGAYHIKVCISLVTYNYLTQHYWNTLVLDFVRCNNYHIITQLVLQQTFLNFMADTLEK